MELVVEAHPNQLAGGVWIEVDRERRRVQRIGCGGRDAAEIEVEVLDFASPVAGETNLGAGADREACLCRAAVEARRGRVGAGDDEGNIDRNLDGDFDRIAVFVDVGDGALLDDVDCRALDDVETRTGDGARGPDPADGETAGGVEEGIRRRAYAEPRAQR